jgi:hypothetical protein
MFFYADSNDEESILRAFGKCAKLMQDGEGTEFAFIVPQVATLEGVISAALPESIVKALEKTKSFSDEVGTVHLFLRSDPPCGFKGPLLLVYMEVEELKPIILDNPDADIIFVPMDVNEKEFFIDEYSPELI